MSAGEDDGDGPTGTRVPAPSLDLALDDPEHPAWAHRYGEGTVNERLSAAPVPLGLVIRQAIGSRLGEAVPTLAQLVVSFDVELTVLGVVALLELVDHRVPHEARLVIPGFPGGVVILASDLEEFLPGCFLPAEKFGKTFPVGGHVRLLE